MYYVKFFIIMGSSNTSINKPKEYPHIIHKEHKDIDSSGKSVTKLDFRVNIPISQYSISVILNNQPISVSGCILPGQNICTTPNTKQCQDNYSFIILQNTIFLMLFDGHGINGHLVAQFCIDFYSQFFYKQFKDFLYDTKNTIKELFVRCDEALKESKIDCELSGATSIAIFITATHLYVASVGDSRAILCTEGLHNMLNASQLTTDQKPSHSAEYKRIKASGGSVRRFIDENGQKKGPYRI